MPRLKEFDPDQALERAMRAFWARGYEGTSIQDLLAAMEINRASLYATFGDKEQLFLKAIDRYGQRVFGPLLEPLEREPSGRRGLELFFARLLEQVWRPDCPRGCLVTNSALEISSVHPAIAQKIGE